MANIKDSLVDLNPWWKQDFKPEIKEREVYKKIKKFLFLPQIIALTGLRRVGKTTLAFKIIQDFIGRGFDAKNIVYFSFDEFKTIQIREIIGGYEELMQEIRNKKLEIRSLYTGDEIQIQNLKFKIIWPERGFESKELNDTAIVGRLSFGGFDALLTGDADSRVELAEMATGLIVPVEVLKVPHHGSKTGMLASWLKQVKPKLAVISVGKTNGYGHPSSEAIKLLQEVGSKMMRTDRDGEVEVVSDGKRWWVSSRSTN